MNVAKLNVVIDPSQASSGATAAVQAAKAVEAALKSAGAEAKKLGGAFDAMSQQTAKSGGMLKSAFSGMMATFKSVGSGVLMLGAAFGALQAAMLPVMATIKLVTGAFTLLSSAVNGAADFEIYTIQFANLLGTFEKADVKMKELSDLAAKTPFNLPDIVKGTLSLHSLSEGVLSTKENLLKITDAAAKANLGFEEMGSSIARFYIGAKTGGEILEQLNTLTKQNIISADSFVKIRNLALNGANEGGKNFVAIWKAVDDSLKRAAGSGELLSRATKGLFSTLGDSWDAFQRTFGAALNEGIRPITRMITAEIDTWTEKAKAIAPQIATVAKQVAAVFGAVVGSETPGDATMKKLYAGMNAGKYSGLDGILQPAKANAFTTALQAGLDTATQSMQRGITAAGAMFSVLMNNAGVLFQNFLSRVGTWDFWKGLNVGMQNAAATFINTINEGINKIMANLMKGTGLAFVDKMPSSIMGSAQFAGDVISTLVGAVGTGKTVDDLNAEMEARILKYAETSAPTGGFNGIIAPVPVPESAPNPLLPMPTWKDAMGPELPQTDAQKQFADNLERQIAALNSAPSSRDNSLLTGNIGKGTVLQPSDPAIAAEEAKNLEEAAKAAKKMTEAGKKVTEDMMTPLEKYNAGLKEVDAMLRAGAISEQTAGRKRIDLQNELTAALKKTERAANSQFQTMMTSWQNTSYMIDQANIGIAHSFTNHVSTAFTDFITGTKTAGEAFSSMALGIVQDIIQITMRMLIMRAIGGIFGGAGGAAASAVGSYHTGGTIGSMSDAPGRSVVPASAFSNAPRFQHGGVVPSGERAIVTEPGETVLTRAQSSDIKSRMGKDTQAEQKTPITIVNVTDPALIEQAMAKNPGMVLNIIGQNKQQVKRMLA